MFERYKEKKQKNILKRINLIGLFSIIYEMLYESLPNILI